MAWRCEIRNRRTGEWYALDEECCSLGQRWLSRAQYERGVLRGYPILASREYRIVKVAGKKVFSMPWTFGNETLGAALTRAARASAPDSEAKNANG